MMKHEVCGFEHLHLHSDLSLLDGFGMVEEYAKRWKGFGDYLCISDHGMMAAIPSQIRNCKATGDAKDPHKDKNLIPLFACELYVNPLQIQYHNDKEFKDYQKTLDPDQLKSLRRSHHLLAIAHSEVGYSNLVTLSSLAWIHGFYYRPRVNHELLMQYKEGITFTSCCYASEVGQAFDKGGEEAGFAMIEKYMAMFGEHYCLEFMLLDFIKQKPYNQFILKAKEKYKLPVIVTNDCHYCNKEDSQNQRLMLMVQTKNTIQDIQKKIEEAGSQDLFELQDTNLWQKSEDELNEKWESDYSDVIDYELFKEAKRTTVEICRKAGGVKLDRSMKLPQIPDANEKLREAVFEGFKSRNLPQDKVYGNRLREEFELIFSKGFSSYFLILKATIDEARRYSMEVFGHPNVIGPGRGCLAPSVNIVMADGKFKKIKDIHADDKVVGRDGSINRVLGIFKYSVKEELLCIKSYYGDNNGVTLTKDHKILVEKLVRPINYDTWANSTKAARKNSIDPVGNLDWVSANNIAVGDWVFIPTPRLPEIPFDIFDLSVLTHDKTILTFDNDYVYQGKLNPLTKNVKPILKLSRYLTLNEDAYRVLGLFAGDGWIKSSGCEVGFAFNKNDKDGIDFLINFMDRIGISVKMVDHNIKELTQCKVYSRHFQLFIKHCFPNYKGTPHTKHVPYFLFNQNENRKQAFLKGYLFADGNVAEYKCSYSTVSENLASQVRFLCWQVGIPASLCFNNRIDKRDGRESVEIKINIPHHLAITESRDGQECFYRKIDNGLLMKVRSIEKVSGINEVYDLNIENQHNYLTTSFQVHNSDVGSLLCYCLRITNVDPIQHDLLFSRFLSKARNDLPDADVDFLPQVRDYLKNDWAPSYFGRDNVANIGSYNTFGIKSSLIDMVRVHGKDRNEILNLTTKLGLKDDDGNVLTWDKALEIYPELKKYCEENPDIAASAKKLINRSRSMGKHAGGIIISSQPINKFVPLVRGKEGEIVSSWTEGLHDQDLGPMGFVKYDWLVITNLEQINYACKIIKERYGLTGICNKQGQEDWSDSSFINDPASITMANEADLKGIFQFDSDGIRHLVRKGGVNTFNDLVAYASLYRPGPMSEGMHDEYCDRKKGVKEFVIHELLKPVLGNTYGVICVHEDVMISLVNGMEVPLKLIKGGDFVHSVNEVTKEIEFNVCHGSSPTRVCDGIKITLRNGYSVIVTPDHKIMTYDGMKEARHLDLDRDLVMVPKKLPQKNITWRGESWLGKDIDVAYLLGQLIGDGAVSSTNTDICTGTKENHDKLFKWLNNAFTSLNFREYFHCRSWYIAISGKELMNDTKNYGNRKTRFNVFLESIGIRGKNCHTKFIPDIIMVAPSHVRRAFIAGILDSDGCIGVGDNGLCHCNLTSVSEKVRNSFRKLLLLDGISNSIDDLRVYVSNVKRLDKLVSKYLVIKSISGKLTNGRSQYFIPRKLLIDKKNESDLSARQWSKDNNIDRQHFNKKRAKFISDKFSKFLGVETREIGYVRIKKIEKVENQQFYGLAVENNHNFIANGIVVSNCYQEQCMRILHIVGDIPLEDCEILRKAISKKKEEYFAKYKVMFIQNGMKNLGWTEEEVINLWKLLEAFAGYAFNMCLVGDTRVYDERGNLLLIKDVYNKFNNGEEICLQSLDVNGLMTVEKVTEVFDNGPQDVFVLKLSTGQRIRATAGHRFLTDEGWMALKDLSVGGWVATPNKIVCAELDFDIEDYKIICLAYFLSEGNTCHPSSLYFYNNDLNLVNDFVNNASLFGESNITVNQRTSGNYYVTINSGHKGDCRNYSKTNILEWVDNIGIRYKSAKKKSLPSFIYSFSRPQISLLLAKMWEGDGHIGKTAYYATSSKTLAEQVQSLLLRLNITSTVGRKKFKYRGSYKIGFVVNLHGENWVRKFKDTIGEFIVSKKEILSSMLENSKNYDVIPYSFFKLIRDEIDISGMTSAKICDICGISVRLLNFDAHKKGFTRGIVKKIGIAINSVKLLKLATSDIYWSKVRSIRQAGKHDTYDITVNNTHSFVANDIISHNSHACAYTYISSMLLWLKSHYPLEFYTAILHFETDADKIKEYRLDAQRHDIVINPLDLNKSKSKFDITDNEIYFGFANVKGIGEVVAQKIIDNQPYTGFSDFLTRCGTDESIVKPLIGLRIFEKEGDPTRLYSYYKWFKDIKEKRESRKGRFEVSCEKDIESAKALGFEITDHNDVLKLTDSRDEVQKLVIKHDKLIKNYFKRETVDDKIPGLDRFVILPDDKPIEIPEKLVALFASPEECEMQFYGFLWHHPICKSPDYEGKRTFDIYKEKGLQQGYVEVMINSVAKQTSKKNTSYWLIKAEDANGESAQIQVWEDDWLRFKDDLKVGQYVKMEVKAPDKGFYRYTLYSPPKWLRTKLVPKTRAVDMRVWVLRKPELPE